MLKAIYVKINDDYPPYTHNLIMLAEKCNILLDDEKKSLLVTINAFNINGRYDDYKKSFQKKCTPEFTKEWIEKLKEIRIWIKKFIPL